MRFFRSPVFAALAGAAAWTATEYGLHRSMHQMRGRGMASVEHLKHHADVTYFAPASKKAASAAATVAISFPLASAVAGRRWSAWFTTAMISTYYAYEVAHRRTHTHPPANAYGRWARRSHMHHHFGAPMGNFGVTSPVWDHAFGTYDEPGVVIVPRRMAPAWLLDGHGEVHSKFSGDYVVRGKRRDALDSGRVERDHADAFANAVPPNVS